jgi:hypothetical protein
MAFDGVGLVRAALSVSDWDGRVAQHPHRTSAGRALTASRWSTPATTTEPSSYCEDALDDHAVHEVKLFVLLTGRRMVRRAMSVHGLARREGNDV